VSSFNLVWSQNSENISQLTFPITFPGVTTDGLPVLLLTSAALNQTFETLTSVAFYLIGSDVPVVQGEWPYLGNAYSPARPDLNGGFEISFDGGNTWKRFNKTLGWQSDRSTWISLDQEAIGSAGFTGQLGPYDVANLVVRYVIPPGVTLSKILDVQLAVGCEVC
jgi:hypothetical protein